VHVFSVVCFKTMEKGLLLGTDVLQAAPLSRNSVVQNVKGGGGVPVARARQ
jgi:hypothetical protein